MTVATVLILLLIMLINESKQVATNSSRPRAAGYNIYVQRSNFAIAQNAPRYGIMNAIDFNPALLAGNRRFPGIRLRANARAFQYASALAAGIVSQQIGRAQIPDISQCVPQVNGCVRVYNMYIAYYRCPENVAIYPMPYGRIVFSIRNFEIRIMGRLGGQVNVLIPLGLFGILCMDADQISLDVELTLVTNAMGGPAVVVSGCSASVGYVNIYVMNGGIVGFAINTAFRNMVAGQVRQMLPNQLCGMVPGLINNMVNPMLANLPQVIPLSQMLSLVTSVLGAPPQIPAYCYSPLCRGMASTPPPAPKPSPQPTMVQQSAPTLRFRTSYSNVRPNYSNQQQRGSRIMSSVSSIAVSAKRNKRMVGGPCAGCPPPSTIMQARSVQNILQSLDLRKLADLGLSLRLMSSYSTNQDFIVDLSGEFSPRGWGGTPFGPFPVFFPFAFGVPMVEAVLSDYTVNSLLYWMHKREFFAFRIGPEMAAFSNLLNTTCGEDYDDSSETSSEETRATMRRKILRLLRRTKRQSIADLEALGVCIGDIAPALAEKYPNRKLFLIIRTARAPSVIISARNGGTATVDLIADATMYLQGTTKRVGNLRITVVMDITLRLRGNWVGGTMALRVLKIVDTDGTLGVTQDTLDSISSLAKSSIVKMINQALEKGMRIPIPALRLPINLYNMRVGIVEHGIYFGTDISVSPSLLGGISPGPGIIICQM